MGSELVAVRTSGETDRVVVGRVKIESCPLIAFTPGAAGEEVNVIVQDDWHPRVLGPDGEVRNVTELKPGTSWLA